MVGNEAQGGNDFFFANAGHAIGPVNVKARTREEAERKLRELNGEIKPTIETPHPHAGDSAIL